LPKQQSRRTGQQQQEKLEDWKMPEVQKKLLIPFRTFTKLLKNVVERGIDGDRKMEEYLDPKDDHRVGEFEYFLADALHRDALGFLLPEGFGQMTVIELFEVTCAEPPGLRGEDEAATYRLLPDRNPPNDGLGHRVLDTTGFSRATTAPSYTIIVGG